MKPAQVQILISLLLTLSFSIPAISADSGNTLVEPIQSAIITGHAPVHPYVWKVLNISNERSFYIDDENFIGLKYIQDPAAKTWDLKLIERNTSTLETTNERTLVDGANISSQFSEVEYFDAPIFIGTEQVLHLTYSERTIYLMNLTSLQKEWSLTLDDYFLIIKNQTGLSDFRQQIVSPIVLVAFTPTEDPASSKGHLKGLYSINVKNGSIDWYVEAPPGIPFNYYIPSVFKMMGDTILITSCGQEGPSDCDVLAYSAINGTYLWSAGLNDIWTGYTVENLKLYGHILMVSLTNRNYIDSDLTLPPNAIVAIDIRTGERLWTRYLEDPSNQMAYVLQWEELLTWNGGVGVFVTEISKDKDYPKDPAWSTSMNGYTVTGHLLMTFRASDGTPLWNAKYQSVDFIYEGQYVYGGIWRSSVIVGDTLYFVDTEPPAGHTGPCFDLLSLTYRCQDHDTDRMEGTYLIRALDLRTGSEVWRYYVPHANPEIWGVLNGALYVKINEAMFVFKEGPAPGLDLFLQPLGPRLTQPINYFYTVDLFSINFYDNGYGGDPYTTTIELYDKSPELGGGLIAKREMTFNPDGGHEVMLKPLHSAKSLIPFRKDDRTHLAVPLPPSFYVRLTGTDPAEANGNNNQFFGKIMVPMSTRFFSNGDDAPPTVNPYKMEYFALSACLICLGAVMTAGLSEAGRYGIFKGLLIPLYTRLKRKKVLENKLRYMMYGIVLARPGINLGQIKNIIKRGNFVMAYHLQVLEREGYIFSKRYGVKRIFYPVGKMVEDLNGHRNEIEKRILKALQKEGRASVSDICTSLKIERPHINYHIKALKMDGLVETVVEKGVKYLILVPNGQKKDVQALSTGSPQYIDGTSN